MTDIVVVHGLWADGSSWSEVIPLLHAAGHRVHAVQLPLTSVGADVAYTRQIVDRLPGPVVLAGWSYGGAIITNAAQGTPNVSALVYIAAFAPHKGENGNDIMSRYPSTVGKAVCVDEQGRQWIDPDQYGRLFAADVHPSRAAVLASVQKPAAESCFSTASGEPAWLTIPSWYVVAENDRALLPEAQRWMAERIGAATTSVPASHAVLVSQPARVAEVIATAAAANF
ncbi:pimeloyl-ACP methyl ester carboxylesterase [Streptomyces sp. SLBN-118]|uniref:alpha/beta fold hydrolase n=1 Tax=Streptomyces sp. SLBN-118 TaxID=2768454 RepID=UPI001173857F|nr:alpha/beta hydrolase [Streptomyces sp. SLBN-118]TQK50895.1 pimeloyl-ACP methyl ester carboxylesterase [Streptomyces sp. SLBN-118]